MTYRYAFAISTLTEMNGSESADDIPVTLAVCGNKELSLEGTGQYM